LIHIEKENCHREEVLGAKAANLKAISHPIRLCILDCCKIEGECNVTRFIEKTGRPQSTISRHLSILRSAGIVEGRRSGLEVYYSVVDEEISAIIDILTKDLKEEVGD
jgi:ArsR family transcriptional regulator